MIKLLSLLLLVSAAYGSEEAYDDPMELEGEIVGDGKRFETQRSLRQPTSSAWEQPHVAMVPPPNATLDGDRELLSNSHWLLAHNWRRSQFHTSYGKDPKMLKWSDSIAESAQNYANLLSSVDGCFIQHGYQGDSYGGENLYAQWTSNPSSGPPPPEHVMTRWWDSEVNLGFGNGNGHFTQAAWRDTEYAGCGTATKSFQYRQWTLYCHISVCRYVKPGNCNVAPHTWWNNMLADYSPCGPECPNEGCF